MSTVPVPGPGYSPCPRHAGALSRLDFDRAFDIANQCPDCTTWTGSTP